MKARNLNSRKRKATTLSDEGSVSRSNMENNALDSGKLLKFTKVVLNKYIEFKIVKAIQADNIEYFLELIKAYKPLVAKRSIITAALESGDDTVLENIYDVYSEHLTADTKQKFIKQRLLIAVNSSNNELFDELINEFNTSVVDNELIEAVLECDDEEIFKKVYDEFESDLPKETTERFLKKAVENGNESFIEDFFQDLDADCNEDLFFDYVKFIIPIINEKIRGRDVDFEEAYEILGAIEANINFHVVKKVNLYLAQCRNIDSRINAFFLKIYREPEYMGEDISELADDDDVYDDKATQEKYPGKQYSGKTRVCKIIITLLMDEDVDEELVENLLKHNSARELWDELRLLTTEEKVLNSFIEYALKHLAKLGKNSKEDMSFFKKIQQSLQDGLYSPYPIDEFEGDEELKNLRKQLYTDEKLNVENTLTATWIGHPLSTAHRFFGRTPYHNDAIGNAETYFRGSAHPLHGLFENKAKKGEKKGGTGNTAVGYYKDNSSLLPLRFSPYQRGDLYDFLLIHKQNTCTYISESCKSLTEIRIGFYHNYPCLMVYLANPDHVQFKKKPWSNPEKEGWTELVISFFVGLVNYMAQKTGFPLELVRRSSFGFLTPTISPCHQSFRINVGIIPRDYAFILIKCLSILEEVLKIFKDKDKYKKRLFLQRPERGCLAKKDEAAYVKYKKKALPPDVDLLDLAWTGITRRDEGKTNPIQTGAIKITRDLPVARNQFTAVVYTELVRAGDKLDEIDCANAFLLALRQDFERCTIKDGVLTYVQPTGSIKLDEMKSSINYKVVDTNFFKDVGEKINLVIERYKAIKNNVLSTIEIKVINALQKNVLENNLDGFYYNLEKFNELIFAKILSFNSSPEEACGSDSDIEEGECLPLKAIYGKKAIVEHGSMSIEKALEITAIHLKKNKKIKIYFGAAYYEVVKNYYPKIKEELEKASIMIAKAISKKTAHVLVYDTNPSVTTEEIPVRPKIKDFPAVKVWIIDVTSATIKEQHDWITDFRKTKNATILFLVSSGLKNEQMSADRMAHGTIRYFTKDKKVLNALTTSLRVKSEVSGLPHNYRRLMKVLGCVPSNNSIVRHKESTSVINNANASTAAAGTSSQDNEDKSGSSKKPSSSSTSATSKAPAPQIDPELEKQQSFADHIVSTPLYRELIGGLQPSHVIQFEKGKSTFLQSDERLIILLYEARKRGMNYVSINDENNPACNALEFETGFVILPEIDPRHGALSVGQQLKSILEKYKNKLKPIYLCYNKDGLHYTTLVIIPRSQNLAYYRYIEPLSDSHGELIGLKSAEEKSIIDVLNVVFPQKVEVLPSINYQRQQYYKGNHNNECGIHNVFNTLLMLQRGSDVDMSTMRQHFPDIPGINPSRNGGIDPHDAQYYLRPSYSKLFQLILTYVVPVLSSRETSMFPSKTGIFSGSASTTATVKIDSDKSDKNEEADTGILSTTAALGNFDDSLRRGTF